MTHRKSSLLTVVFDTLLRKRMLAIYAVCVVMGVVSYALMQEARTDRNWEKEFAVLPQVVVQGDLVQFQNIRDWRYSEDEVISHNYTSRVYNLDQFERMWFVLEPFGLWEAAAHTYFVFDFVDAEPIAFSIEARREESEVYDGFSGMLGKYELAYLWGTEADFTAKRVLFEKNEVYMFPVQASREFGKALFLELALATETLRHSPQLYNTLTSNCTNNLADHANSVTPGAIPLHYSRILTGLSAEYVHGLGYLDSTLTFSKLKEKFHINTLVEQLHLEENFSQALRGQLLQ
jgi:hypothetical protein